MSKVSCRKAFTTALLKIAKERSDIWAVATDSRGSVTISKFFDELPSQTAEFGIAEQNAVAAAAGISLTGKNVFVTGPACFLAARAFEQVKVDVAYNESNVKIIGVSGGVSYGPLGGTHTSLHDIAGMRALPNLQVFIPSDAVQTDFITRYLADYTGPAYMRTGRGDVEGVYSEGERFEIGKAKEVCKGNDVTIIACGEMVFYAVEAAKLLSQEGIHARVLDHFCIKPADSESVLRAVKETRGIVTVEEHAVFGGLGELVAHAVCENAPGTPVKIMGFPDEEYKVGSSSELFQYYGLDAHSIAQAAKEIVNRKILTDKPAGR